MKSQPSPMKWEFQSDRFVKFYQLKLDFWSPYTSEVAILAITNLFITISIPFEDFLIPIEDIWR